MYAVIMAGGSGTRFWPRSRRTHPKQLLRIVGRDTMIQETVARFSPEVRPDEVYVITAESQAAMTRSQLPLLPPGNIIAEPYPRDTAACIGLAATMLTNRDPDAVMIVTPADHSIRPKEEFIRMLKTAERFVRRKPVLLTFGIKPPNPSTLFGYIHRGEPIDDVEGCNAYAVAEFKEKPARRTARRFVESKEYYWNSGIFVWKAQDILTAIEKHMPELHTALKRISAALGTPREEQVIREEYEPLQKISIDYGVMERATNTVVLEATYRWDDVGSWESLGRLYEADNSGNVILAKHRAIDTANCIIAGEDDHLIATIGVSGLIIVQTPDATLICDRSRSGDVKLLVERLRQEKQDRYL